MTSQERALQEFAEFAAKLKGDEKSEAQRFLFHLLEAFNHDVNTLPKSRPAIADIQRLEVRDQRWRKQKS